MPYATMTSKGQITVPKEVREHLGLRPGVRVDFQVNADQSATICPAVRTVSQVFGMLSGHRKKKAVSVEEMHQDVRKGIRKGKIRI